MSGGHFQYEQYKLGYIADAIEQLVRDNDRTDHNEWGDPVGHGYEPATIARFNEALKALRVAQVYAQRIDWLVSGDDGEDSFHRRLAEELERLA